MGTVGGTGERPPDTNSPGNGALYAASTAGSRSFTVPRSTNSRCLGPPTATIRWQVFHQSIQASTSDATAPNVSARWSRSTGHETREGSAPCAAGGDSRTDVTACQTIDFGRLTSSPSQPRFRQQHVLSRRHIEQPVGWECDIRKVRFAALSTTRPIPPPHPPGLGRGSRRRLFGQVFPGTALTLVH